MLFWIVGGVIGVLGLVVVAWALWGDRARGRKRCGRCWYSMEGVGGLTCPECGRAARSERGLLRTRRRWWRAIGGVIVMGLGALVVVMPVVQRTSAITWLPRPVLVVLVRWTDTEGGAAFEELIDRAGAAGGTGAACAGWSAWEVRWLAEHAGEVVGREAGKAALPISQGDLMAMIRGTKSPAAAQALLRQLRTSRWDVFLTLAMLGRAGAPAIPGVVQAAQDAQTAVEAMSALASIGVGDDRAVDMFAAALTAGVHQRPQEVIGWLLRVAATPAQQARAEKAIRTAMATGDADTRHVIVKMLASDTLPLVLSDELAPELERLIRAGPDQTAELGARVLMRLSDALGPICERLIRGGAGSHAPAVLRAVCMRKSWPPMLIDSVRWAVEHGPDTSTRWTAANTAICVGRGDAGFAELLTRRAVDDGDARVRTAVLWALHQIAPAEVVRRAAVAALADAHPDVRGSAVGVLELLGSSDAAAREVLCAARVELDEKLAARVRARCEAWAEEGSAGVGSEE